MWVRALPAAPPMRPLAAIVVPALFAVAPAQEGEVWRIPEGGAALYSRQTEMTFVGEETRKTWPGSRSATRPILFHSDLDDDQQRMARDIVDIRSIAPALAFDLTLTPGRVQTRRFPYISKFGDIVAKVRLLPTSQEGYQIQAQLSTEDSDDQGDSAFGKLHDFYHTGKVTGVIRIQRDWDAERGLITGFRWQPSIRWTRNTADGIQEHRSEGEESWQLMEVMPGQTQRFAVMVGDARQHAVTRLLKARETSRMGWDSEGGYGNLAGMAVRAYHVHGLAMGGLQFEQDGPEHLLRDLWREKARFPRDYMEALLAIEAVHGDGQEGRRRALSGDLGKEELNVPTALRRKVRTWMKGLMATRNPNVSPPEGLKFSHSGAAYFSDPQHTMLAALALEVAARSGVRVSDDVWRALVRSLLDMQEEPVEGNAVWTTARGEHGTDRIAGWKSHHNDGSRPNGEATAAAVAALARIGRRLGQSDKDLKHEAEAAVRRGLGWMAQHFSPRVNPSIVTNDRQLDEQWWRHLALAMEATGVQTLGGVDWYFEVSLYLLHGIHGDGNGMGNSGFGASTALQFWMAPSQGPQTESGR